MTTTTFNDPHARRSSRTGASPRERAPKAGLLMRLWGVLQEAGQRRAAAEVARHLQMHGGRPTGSFEKDIAQMAALHGRR